VVLVAYSIRINKGRQASDYLDKFKKLFWELTEQPKMGIEREELLPNMRSFSVDSHVVFYRLQQSQVEVVRVLQGRQDPRRHIK
jgi:toxin ParE1/3/4